MTNRSAGAGLWLVIGALVLIAMVPKEVWIGLGATVGAVLVAYLVIKRLGQKVGTHKISGRDAHRHEPTLGELMA